MRICVFKPQRSPLGLFLVSALFSPLKISPHRRWWGDSVLFVVIFVVEFFNVVFDLAFVAFGK